MQSLQELFVRRTGLALSALTTVVLVVGYAAVQWLEATRQPTAVELPGGSSPEIAPAPSPQPLVLRPSMPEGALPTAWNMPSEDGLLDVSGDREVRRPDHETPIIQR